MFISKIFMEKKDLEHPNLVTNVDNVVTWPSIGDFLNSTSVASTKSLSRSSNVVCANSKLPRKCQLTDTCKVILRYFFFVFDRKP